MIYKHQQAYYDSLSLSNHQNDSTIFIEFMLDAILETLQDYSLTNSLKDVSELVSEKEQEVFEVVGDYLAHSPIMTSKDLQELLSVSPATARRYLSGFAQKGLLEVSGSTKGKSYSLPKTD